MPKNYFSMRVSLNIFFFHSRFFLKKNLYKLRKFSFFPSKPFPSIKIRICSHVFACLYRLKIIKTSCVEGKGPNEPLDLQDNQHC